MKSKMRANQKGMTLVEVLVALTLFTLAVTTIVAIMVSMANIKYRVMMHDQQTSDQKTKIESNSNRNDMDNISEYTIGGTAKMTFTIGGTLSSAFPATASTLNVFSYQADPTLATVPYDDDWKLYFFTDINKQLRGDFTSNTTSNPDLYKIIVKNTTATDIKLMLTYTEDQLEPRFYENFSQYKVLPNGTPADKLGIKAGAQVAFGVDKKTGGDLKISFGSYSYTINSTAFQGSGNATVIKYTDSGFTI